VASLTLALFAAAGSIDCGGAKETGAAKDTPLGSAVASLRTADSCALLTQSEIAEGVGNPVQKGAPFAGPDVCKWEAETLGDVNVLLTVRLPGTIRERVLCPELLKSGKAAGFEDLGDASTWKFESVAGLFNSGELELCGPKGYLGLTLSGKRDEAALKQGTVAIVRKVSARL
jgi:hypothetical protein